MIRRTVHVALFTGLAVFLAVSSAHAGPRVFIGIGVPAPVRVAVLPPPVVAVPPVAPVPYGYVWRPGYYTWTGVRYRLIPGGYVRPPFAGAVWVGPRVIRSARGPYWVRGYWRR